MAPASIRFSVELGDILTFDADVAAFKYAQAFYGADRAAAKALADAGAGDIQEWELAVGEHRFVDTRGALRAPTALFVGVEPIGHLGYKSIRSFAASVIEAVARSPEPVGRLAMTVHGPGFGLDEVEAFFAEFAGCNEALGRLALPRLTSVVFVEINEHRVDRLTSALREAVRGFGNYDVQPSERGAPGGDVQVATSSDNDQTIAPPPPELPGLTSEQKPHVFVAMPFSEEWDDVFYFGIQEPSRLCGFVCERIDQEAFTGEVVDRLKQRIETAVVVIAELSAANPNVYLEVGYAWGRDRPTILLLRGEDEPKFDVQGHKHLRYKTIKTLQEILATELEGLKAGGQLTQPLRSN